jgi:pimeloyl-ACP methyl ester carboxylesterase
VYLHGLSSFSVEGTFLVQNLEKYLTDLNVSVCLYDLRGHGKDKAHNVTFGIE